MQNEGRIPPYNQEAEVAILGSILLNNECWGEVYAIISSDDFYVKAHRLVFESMYELAAEGISIDHMTLGNKLKSRGDLEKIGGAIALSNLTDSVVTTANVSHYADIVREASGIRRVIYSAQEVVASGFKADGVEGLGSSIEGIVSAAQYLAKRRMPDSLFSLGEKVLDNYKLVASGWRGIELPWKSLDNMTAGLWPKTVTMFVARPSVGKTFIAVIIARHAWIKGRRVLILSPEMPKDEIAERFFVIDAGLNYHHVITGDLPTRLEEKFKSVVGGLQDKEGLYIMDSDDDLTPRGIDAAIRACHPDLIACDSMYDLKIKGDRKDRMLRALEWGKNASKEHGFAFVGFVQQNRIAELSEKKGGGSRLGTIALTDEIGQDAQTVIALEQTKDDKADGVIKFRPLKIRRGQVKRPVVKSYWKFDVMNFDEIEENGSKYETDNIPF